MQKGFQAINFFLSFMRPNVRIALAVSGGVDSTVLAHMTHRWIQKHGGKMVAFIVDHGLRTESADESWSVCCYLRSLGISSFILKWHGEKPVHGIQNAARKKRYELLIQACRSHSIPSLFVAHHEDDQLETFLMRQQRGSHWRGLACMSSTRLMWNVKVMRPLLKCSRNEIMRYAQNYALTWVNDPSNAAARFMRTHMRREVSHMSQQKRQNTLHIMQNYAFKRQTEAYFIYRMLSGNFFYCARNGYIVMRRSSFEHWMTCAAQKCASQSQISADWFVHACGAIFACVAGQHFLRSTQCIQTSLLRIMNMKSGKMHTQSGCLIYATHQHIYIMREWKRIPKHYVRVTANNEIDVLWDGRFFIQLMAENDKTVCISAQGYDNESHPFALNSHLSHCIYASYPIAIDTNSMPLKKFHPHYVPCQTWWPQFTF